MAGWKAWKHTAVYQPRWQLHAWRGGFMLHHGRRAQDADSPAGLGDGWVEADDSRGCRYLHGTGHRTDWAGTSRARDREQARTPSTSSHGAPKGACTPAGRPRWGFHPCNHTANTTQVNQGGGWWPSRNGSRRAGSSSMLGGYAGSDGRCVTTQASNRCRRSEAINTSAAWDWGKAQGNQCSPVVSHHSE